MRFVGDQIVEINGKRVAAFDEFLEQFLAAQVQAAREKLSCSPCVLYKSEGFPIVFSVLRREAPEETPDEDRMSFKKLEVTFQGLILVEMVRHPRPRSSLARPGPAM